MEQGKWQEARLPTPHPRQLARQEAGGWQDRGHRQGASRPGGTLSPRGGQQWATHLGPPRPPVAKKGVPWLPLGANALP